MESSNQGVTYAEAGVDSAKVETALKEMLTWITKSFNLRRGIGEVKLNIGYYANIIDIGNGMGLALSTDSVGTKVLIAQMMNKYDTIGIDCVAMSVNDIICVGAEPITMLDYIAVAEAAPDFMEDLAKGLYRGAELANVTIAGGEIAQVGEILRGTPNGHAFDLVGMSIGTVPLDKIIIGEDLEEGDVIIGLASNGIHSNGLSLARKIFFEQQGFSLDKYFPELGRTIGEELLEPTHIYVSEIMEMLKGGVKIKALFNITGDGLLNLLRFASPMGLIVNHLRQPQPIFKLIQEYGKISDEEMYTVFNMGIGFCVIAGKSEVGKVKALAGKHGVESCEMGYVVKEPENTVIVESKGLVFKETKNS